MAKTRFEWDTKKDQENQDKHRHGATLRWCSSSVKDSADNSFASITNYGFRTTASPFNIELAYTGGPGYQTYFDQAKAIWQRVIIGDLPDAGAVDDIKINAAVAADDGVGGRLGFAGPTSVRTDSALPVGASMSFDAADMADMAANGTLLGIILHEMGHALGFGSLWDQAKFRFNTTAGHYTGAKALDVYRQMSGDAAATFVPLETAYGAGTNNAHWTEAVFDRELMTGIAESSLPMPMSKLTIAAMEDLGYQVNYAAAEFYSIPAGAKSPAIHYIA